MKKLLIAIALLISIGAGAQEYKVSNLKITGTSFYTESIPLLIYTNEGKIEIRDSSGVVAYKKKDSVWVVNDMEKAFTVLLKIIDKNNAIFPKPSPSPIPDTTAPNKQILALKIPVEEWNIRIDSIQRFVIPVIGVRMYTDEQDIYQQILIRQIVSLARKMTVDSTEQKPKTASK